MSFLFASSHLPETRVQRPEDEEEDDVQPMLHSGGVRAFSHLPLPLSLADTSGPLSTRPATPVGRPRPRDETNDDQDTFPPPGRTPTTMTTPALMNTRTTAPGTCPASPRKTCPPRPTMKPPASTKPPLGKTTTQDPAWTICLPPAGGWRSISDTRKIRVPACLRQLGHGEILRMISCLPVRFRLPEPSSPKAVQEVPLTDPKTRSMEHRPKLAPPPKALKLRPQPSQQHCLRHQKHKTEQHPLLKKAAMPKPLIRPDLHHPHKSKCLHPCCKRLPTG